MIKIQEMVSFPIFAENGQKIQPDTAKYSAGFQESDVLPAEWVNYFENKSSSAITTLNTGITSIEEELNALVEAGGQSPTATDNSQVLKSIQYLINQAVKQSALASYPIGALYWSSNPTNPREFFGGEWKQIKDRFILAAGDKLEFTGGADDETIGYGQIKLTESNLPAHKHNYTPTGDISEALSNDGYFDRGNPSNNGGTETDGTIFKKDFSFSKRYENEGSDGNFNPRVYAQLKHSHIFYGKEESTNEGYGKSDAFSVMPPYVAKYCWERTA